MSCYFGRLDYLVCHAPVVRHGSADGLVAVQHVLYAAAAAAVLHVPCCSSSAGFVVDYLVLASHSLLC